MAANDNLSLVDKALRSGNCGDAIRYMRCYLSAWPEQHTAEKVTLLGEDYDRMVAYWQQGGNDPQREQLYQQLLQRMYVIYANVAHYHRMKASPYQNSLYTRVRQAQRDWSLTAIRQEMEGFVSNVAMLQLEQEHKRAAKSETLYREHQQQMNQLFEYVITSRQWSDSVGAQFTEMMVSPTIDSNDQQLVMAAVTLSLMNQFDMAKFRMLVQVYQQSQDDAVRQRALVGWVLATTNPYQRVYPEQQELIAQLTQSEEVCQELTELQIQFIYCLNERKSTDTIEKEIMPDLMNSSLKMTPRGIEETEEDHLEDVLHPEASEERMERLEASCRRMMDMQKEGADVFFRGFSQTKRHPFFYDISNWMVPFYMQHPDIAQYMSKLTGLKLLDKILGAYQFCNSDKYSFVLALHEIVDRMPQNIRQMMNMDVPVPEDAEQQELSPALVRRMYLMDIYRFFRLFSHRSELYNPFDANEQGVEGCIFFSADLFANTPLEKSKGQIVRQLKKYKLNRAANSVLDSFAENYRDVQYYLWKCDYEKVLQLDPENERATLGMARQLYGEGQYEKAVAIFQRLMTVYPDKTNYQLHVAVCQVQLKQYEEALKVLYRLNYEQPENDSVNRVLAWTLTCQGKLEQAAKLYEQLVHGEQLQNEDRKNYGYCLWLQGKIDRAIDMFKHYRQVEETSSTSHFFDIDWLQQRGISATEIKMMESLLFS